jgi:hypothetical protein
MRPRGVAVHSDPAFAPLWQGERSAPPTHFLAAGATRSPPHFSPSLTAMTQVRLLPTG